MRQPPHAITSGLLCCVLHPPAHTHMLCYPCCFAAWLFNLWAASCWKNIGDGHKYLTWYRSFWAAPVFQTWLLCLWSPKNQRVYSMSLKVFHHPITRVTGAVSFPDPTLCCSCCLSLHRIICVLLAWISAPTMFCIYIKCWKCIGNGQMWLAVCLYRKGTSAVWNSTVLFPVLKESRSQILGIPILVHLDGLRTSEIN